MAVIADAGTEAATIYQVHTDHLERPIMMTDSARNLVWRATYLPYGEAYTILGSATLDQRFRGNGFNWNPVCTTIGIATTIRRQAAISRPILLGRPMDQIGGPM
ncbi:hypothetical protein BTN45_05430 [Rhizobium sp. ZX09]|nr:hypothetical protein BTN45_05430 [Rhizobium sp. ZX09]